MVPVSGVTLRGMVDAVGGGSAAFDDVDVRAVDGPRVDLAQDGLARPVLADGAQQGHVHMVIPAGDAGEIQRLAAGEDLARRVKDIGAQGRHAEQTGLHGQPPSGRSVGWKCWRNASVFDQYCTPQWAKSHSGM